MIRVKREDIAAFIAVGEQLTDVEFDHARGELAAKLHSNCLLRNTDYTFRLKALNKERKKLLDQHAQKDAKGEYKYGESPTGRPVDRPILMKDQAKWEKATEPLQERFDAAGAEIVELDLAPLADDFFAKPNEVLVKHGVRIAFLPFMKAAQDAAANAAKKKAKK